MTSSTPSLLAPCTIYVTHTAVFWRIIKRTDRDCCADAAPVVSKLTLVRSKTDNVLVIKNKQPAEQQQQQARKSRAGRALKPKRPKLDADSTSRDESDRPSTGEQVPDDEDVQCKIVRVILENCKTSTTSSTTTTPENAAETALASSPSPDAAEVATTTVPSVAETPSIVTPRLVASSEPPRSLPELPTVASASTCGVAAVSTWLEKTQQSMTSAMPDVSANVLASATSLRPSTPLNGVVSQLPLALGQPVHAVQFLGHPAVRSLPPAGQRWSVPLVNGAGAWLTLQPVASTPSASIVAPSPASFGLIPAPTAARAAPPRPSLPVVVDQPPRQSRPHVPVAHSSSVINSPIKQFLDHTRSVPLPPATDDVPTDLSMKTLRRLEENAVPATTTVAQPTVQYDDVPLDLCTKRATSNVDYNPVRRSADIAATKTPPVMPILTVPLCFSAGPVERPAVAVAGQVVPATTTPSTPAITLLRPPTPLVKIDPATAARAPTAAAAGGTTFPVSPITILHPAFRQLSPLLCSPLLMTPFAAVPSSSSSS